MSEELLASKEWCGVWWHPSAPDDVVSGTLTFTPGDGLRLSLIGVLEDPTRWSLFEGLLPGGNQDRTHWDVLNGKDTDDRTITLCDVHLVKSNPRQVVCQELIVARALVGCHLPDSEQPVFQRINATIEGLDDFVGQQVSAAPEGQVQFELDGGFAATLRRGTQLSGEYSLAGASQSRVTDTGISAQSVGPRSAQELIGVATTVEALVSLVHQCPMRIRTLHLGCSADSGMGFEPVEVFQPASAADGRRSDRPRRLFGSGVVPPEKLIPQWFVVMERYRGACQMLLTLLYEENEFINPRVVTAVTAAEAMHSALVRNSALPKATALSEDDYDTLVTAAIASVPRDAQERMKGLFRKNVAGLAGRLEALATGTDGKPLGGLLTHPEPWAKAAAQARNGIAHGSINGVAGVRRLHAIVETCNALVTLRLLEQLGHTQDELWGVVERSTDLRWVRDLAAHQFESSDVE